MTTKKRRTPDRDPAQLDGPPPVVEGLDWASTAAQQRIEWYLPGAIPGGAITLLEGRKSTGKSSLAAAIVACMTGGPVVPGWTGPRDSRVIWVGGEESWEQVIVPRLDAAGADVRRVCRLTLTDTHKRPRRAVLPDDVVILQDVIREGGVGAVILDPYISLAHHSLDMRIEQQARMYLEPLAATLAACQCVGLLIRHLRKGTGGDSREAGLGSVAVANVARSLLRCDEHPHQQGCYVLSVVASNQGRRLATQVYRIVDQGRDYPRIEWDGACDLDADTIAEGRGSEAERDEWGDADRCLCQIIGDGWVPVAEIEKEALAGSISPRMLRRAKARLRIPSRREQRGSQGWWEWGPPANGWPASLTARHLPTAGGEARAGAERLGRVDAKKPRRTRSKQQGGQGAPAQASPPLGAPETEVNNGQA